MSTAGNWLRRWARAPAWPRSAPPGRARAVYPTGDAPLAFPASVCRPCAPPAAGTFRPPEVHSAPSASSPPRRLRLPAGFRRRCRQRLCFDAPVPRRASTRRAELSGRREHGTSSGVAASPPRRARAEVHGLCRWGDWPSPCPYPSLATRASPKCAAFPTPSCVVSAILGTMPRSDSLRTVPAFALGLYRDIASAAIDFTDGCGRASPVDRPTFAACHLPYAGAVPGCSRIHGPDCCLRPKAQGSARSVPHGLFFRRGRVHLRCGLQLRFSSLRRRNLARRRRLTSGLLWRLARAGLTPADRSALRWAHCRLRTASAELVGPDSLR